MEEADTVSKYSVPDLLQLVPAAAHDDGVGSVGTEPHTGHAVAVTLVSDVVLAVDQSVPQLDGLVPVLVPRSACSQRW